MADLGENRTAPVHPECYYRDTNILIHYRMNSVARAVQPPRRDPVGAKRQARGVRVFRPSRPGSMSDSRGAWQGGQCCVISRLEERVRQRDTVHATEIGVSKEGRVNVEEHRQLHSLVRRQLLLLEAKALNLPRKSVNVSERPCNLDEVLPSLHRRHIVAAYSDHRSVRMIRHFVARQNGLA
jgi:hypothetical protein